MRRFGFHTTLADLFGYTTLVALATPVLLWSGWDAVDRTLLIAWGCGVLLGLATGRSRGKEGIFAATIGAPACILLGAAGFFLATRISGFSLAIPWGEAWSRARDIGILLTLGAAAAWLVALSYVLTGDLLRRVQRQLVEDSIRRRRLRILWPCGLAIAGLAIVIWRHEASPRLTRWQTIDLIAENPTIDTSIWLAVTPFPLFGSDGVRMCVSAPGSVRILQTADRTEIATYGYDEGTQGIVHMQFTRAWRTILSNPRYAIQCDEPIIDRWYSPWTYQQLLYDLATGHEYRLGLPGKACVSASGEHLATVGSLPGNARQPKWKITIQQTVSRTEVRSGKIFDLLDVIPLEVSDDGRVMLCYTNSRTGWHTVVYRFNDEEMQKVGEVDLPFMKSLSPDGNWLAGQDCLIDTRSLQRREFNGEIVGFLRGGECIVVQKNYEIPWVEVDSLPIVRSFLHGAKRLEVVDTASGRRVGVAFVSFRKSQSFFWSGQIPPNAEFVPTMADGLLTLWRLPDAE